MVPIADFAVQRFDFGFVCDDSLMNSFGRSQNEFGVHALALFGLVIWIGRKAAMLPAFGLSAKSSMTKRCARTNETAGVDNE
jgi:hypothetical protein